VRSIPVSGGNAPRRILLVMESTLILCIGNKARGDDGAARYVAELLGDRLPDAVTLVSTPQLDIVMAQDVAGASRVLFVDAARRALPAVHVQPQPPGTAGTHAHGVDPAGLMSLAETLYGATPTALLVSIAAPDMGHHEGLSAIAKAASEEAALVVLGLLQQD